MKCIESCKVYVILIQFLCIYCNCRDKYVDVESEEGEDQDQVLVEEGHVGLDSCKRKIDPFFSLFISFQGFSIERPCLFIILLLICLLFFSAHKSNSSICMFDLAFFKTQHKFWNWKCTNLIWTSSWKKLRKYGIVFPSQKNYIQSESQNTGSSYLTELMM